MNQQPTMMADRSDTTRFDWLMTVAGAFFAAVATTYYMTVTDPDHIYEGDFVLAYTDGGRTTAEVLDVHQETNTLAVRVYRDGDPTNEILTTPAGLVDLHPDGRPLADDDEWDDGFTEYDVDDESLDNYDFDNDEEDT